MGLFDSKFDDKQFRQLSLLLADIAKAKDVREGLAQINQTLADGFAAITVAISTLNIPAPEPTKPVEVTFVFKVADDHQEEPFSISIGGVTDAEGHAIPDPSGLEVEVESSDDDVVSVVFDSVSRSGSVSFGAPGVASVTATVKNKKGDILGSGAANFTITTGDPAAVSDIKLAFGGLTEEPDAGSPGDSE